MEIHVLEDTERYSLNISRGQMGRLSYWSMNNYMLFKDRLPAYHKSSKLFPWLDSSFHGFQSHNFMANRWVKSRNSVFPMWAHFISLDEELISFCHWQKLPKRELVRFTCLLRCIDHTNVISKLEGTQHSSEDSQNQGPGDLRGMKHRAGKHQAISVTHHPSVCSMGFWQVPWAGSCLSHFQLFETP